MENFRVTLVNKIKQKEFNLQLVFEPIRNENIEFKFGNSSKSLERKNLEFLDEKFNIIEPSGYRVINPAKYEKESIVISKDKPFTYDILGKIEIFNTKALIKLVSAEYVLDLDKKYFVQFDYLGKKSNRIDFEIK